MAVNAAPILIKSDETEHAAMHKGAALRLIPNTSKEIEENYRNREAHEAEETTTPDARRLGVLLGLAGFLWFGVAV
jgi:hypothetical protein